jgi:hypothetical protein
VQQRAPNGCTVHFVGKSCQLACNQYKQPQVTNQQMFLTESL